jgi:hypothetical protein
MPQNRGTSTASALAYQHDFGADISRAYQREELLARQRAEKERKAMFYGEMLKAPHVVGPGATRELDEYVDTINKEIADFAIANPDFETDAGKFAEFRSIADKYINNPIVQKDQQVATEFEAMKKDRQQGLITPEQAIEEMDKYNNYKENGGEGYVYVRPNNRTMNDIIKDSKANIQSKTDTYTDPETGALTKITAPPDAALDSQAGINLRGPDRDIIVQDYEKAGGERIGTLKEFHKNQLKASIDVERIGGMIDQLWKHNNDQSNIPVASRYESSYLEESTKAIATGGDWRSAPSAANRELTKYGGDRKRHILTEGEGIKFMSQEDGQYKDFKVGNMKLKKGTGQGLLGVSAVPESSGSYVVVAGIPYIEQTFTLSFNTDINPDYINTLTANAFQESSKSTIEGIMGGLEFTTDDSRHVSHMTGKLLVPAQLEKENLLAFEDHFYGESSMKSIYAQDARFQQMEDIQIGAVQQRKIKADIPKLLQDPNNYDIVQEGENTYRVSKDGTWRVDQDGNIQMQQ